MKGLHNYPSKGRKVGARIVSHNHGHKTSSKTKALIELLGFYLIPNFQRGYNQRCYMLLSLPNNPCKCNKIIRKCVCWVQSNGQRKPSSPPPPPPPPIKPIKPLSSGWVITWSCCTSPLFLWWDQNQRIASIGQLCKDPTIVSLF